jgi:hypothetical protein
MEFLANSLESRETYTNNLENCATSKQMLQAVLQRDSIKDEPGMEPIPPFDHSRCTDCAYTRAITTDCIDHMTALHNQAMTASRRLQHLVEAREQMRDLAESMELSDGSKLMVDESAIGALEGTDNASYRSLPSYISPRSNPSSPIGAPSSRGSSGQDATTLGEISRRISDEHRNADIDRLVGSASASFGNGLRLNDGLHENGIRAPPISVSPKSSVGKSTTLQPDSESDR